ncbi:MAG: von Willebrand factor type A domain-containing protein, partial [Gemmatimonadota bacterium]
MKAGILVGVTMAVVAPLTFWSGWDDTGRTTGGAVDVAAQDAIAATIEGRVRDAATGEPLGGAQVFVDGTVAAALTGPDGRYTLALNDRLLADGSVSITVRLVGYADQSRSLEVEVGETRTLDFSLARAPIDQDKVVVGGEEADSRPASDSRRDLNEQARNAPIGIVDATSTVAGPPPMGMASIGRVRGEAFNTESYAYVDENGWRSPSNAPLSTFSIDVDRASYSNVRRFITRGERPPIDAVRIEELINYFPYDYPETSGENPFTVSTEVSMAPWNEENYLVRIGVQGVKVDLEDLPPSNLVFLLDVSGSMQAENKLPLLKRSLRLLVNELRPNDRVAVVVYAGAAGLVLESTPGRQRERILAAIEELEAGGSTAGGEGLRLAYEVAARNHIEGGNNRVILATDGDFNIGASSDAEMTRLIEDRRDQGTFLTVLGFGMGNLKDSKMEAIADHGNGNYAYIDTLLEARKVLVTEMGGTLLTIAKDVKIQVEFNPARVREYRLIGYENRLLAAEDFNDDTKDAGELGAGHSVTALYEVVPASAGTTASSSVDPLRYGADLDSDDADVSGFAASSDELMYVKLRYKRPDEDRSVRIDHPVRDRVTRASVDMRFAAAVASFGMILRDSEYSGDFGLRDVSRLARGAIGAD